MNLRDYGLGAAAKPTGKPCATPLPADVQARLEREGGCPNCGGVSTVFEISVGAEHPLLTGGEGITTYMGCAACPWASPAITRAL